MNVSALLADLLLMLHVGVVCFVVGGQLLIMLGGPLGWSWVRRRGFRVIHLALIGFIVVQTWLGALCPLTVWETALRRQAGETGYRESFIEYWLSRLLYIEAPWSAFVVAYSLFGACVLASWWWWPPQRGRR